MELRPDPLPDPAEWDVAVSRVDTLLAEARARPGVAPGEPGRSSHRPAQPPATMAATALRDARPRWLAPGIRHAVLLRGSLRAVVERMHGATEAIADGQLDEFVADFHAVRAQGDIDAL